MNLIDFLNHINSKTNCQCFSSLFIAVWPLNDLKEGYKANNRQSMCSTSKLLWQDTRVKVSHSLYSHQRKTWKKQINFLNALNFWNIFNNLLHHHYTQIYTSLINFLATSWLNINVFKVVQIWYLFDIEKNIAKIK